MAALGGLGFGAWYLCCGEAETELLVRDVAACASAAVGGLEGVGVEIGFVG